MNGMASSRHKCRSTEIRLFFAIININHKHVTSKFMSFKQSFTFFLEVGIIIVILNERIRCLSMTDHIVHVFLAIPPLHFGTYWTYRYPASANEEPGCQEYISGEYINAFTSSKRALESATKPKTCKSITMSIIREEPSSLNKEVNSYKPNNLF